MYKFINNGTVTSANGFKAAGIFCGIKKKKKDLALIYSTQSCTSAGTFTLNKVKAAPLLISQEVIKSDNMINAVLVNSGNANACTGEEGYNNAKLMQSVCAEKLNIKPENVLISSTGVIGQQMPMQNLLNGINNIVPFISADGGHDAAEAILTTDTKQKSFAVKVEIGKETFTIGGICKGSGMIMPNMATMLAFITTDAKVEKSLLQKILFNAVDISFNKISVDGETSTNDMVTIMANGVSGVEINTPGKEEEFQKALNAVSIEMAKSIISDGEGATKLITINVTGANTKTDADLVGKSLSNSPLLKTAIYGEDANWGRIMSSAGMSGAEFTPEKVTIKFDDHAVLLPDYNIVVDELIASKILAKKELNININLNGGKFSSTWWTCDFTENYIKINANYRT
ncbi:MAG: bifunctional ornithine acetyltransferase/N-acetylglutamate synthase [Ignavibacteria bacterium GWB2_35_6b]|nr:MAG: bifunctional ornithine acetyltransferase/N-acetylglutamate synthase [Ignavibacteria bacterium GWB2_35_6b]